MSRRPRGAVRTLSRTIPNTRGFGANALLRNPAEVAQARVFERLLLAECAELQEQAQRATVDEQAETDRSSAELTQIRNRLDEVDALLRALQGRFPHSAPDGDR